MIIRYKVLRLCGCNRFTSILISFLNQVQGIPKGNIVFLHMLIEYQEKDVEYKWKNKEVNIPLEAL